MIWFFYRAWKNSIFSPYFWLRLSHFCYMLTQIPMISYPAYTPHTPSSNKSSRPLSVFWEFPQHQIFDRPRGYLWYSPRFKMAKRLSSRVPRGFLYVFCDIREGKRFLSWPYSHVLNSFAMSPLFISLTKKKVILILTCTWCKVKEELLHLNIKSRKSINWSQ